MPIVGDVLADRYRIESVLGAGGMASVYRATDLRLDRQVAVKVLAANLAADAQFAERFSREAGAMAGFSHPNVAAVYDVEPGDPATGREPFYVMEFCRGGSLADRLKVGGRLPPAELMPIVAAVSEGLAEMHRHGLIHRDIKPANILFSSDRPTLADFGVAWNLGSTDGNPLTLPGSTPGTVPYLAPELGAGEPPSPASDVYALGVTIFRSLTGQYPQTSTVAGSDVDSRPGVLLPVSAAAPDLGTRFDAALARALAVDPAARPSPAELAAQLATGLEVWGVARPNPGAIAAPYPPSGAPSGVDMEAPTLVARERPSAAQPGIAAPVRPVLQQPAARLPAPAPAGRASFVRAAIIVVVLAVLAVLILSRLLGGDGSLPVATASASASASASGSATASASATASGSATASASATPSASASALPSGDGTVLVALGRVDAAIETARGGKDGLNGRDANDLAQLSSSVRTAVDRGDAGAAAAAAQALSDRARAMATGLDGPRRDPLLAAIDGLLAALPPH
jgi:eukaryotic-like serine/threonine-protein kinase